MKKILALVVVSALTVGCAGKVAKFYVEADTATVASLSKFKAEKDVRCDAEQIPASSCQAVAKAFVPVWDAYLAVNKLVTAEAPINEVDAAVVELRAAITDLKDAVASIQGDARKILLDLLEKALLKFEEKL